MTGSIRSLFFSSTEARQLTVICKKGKYGRWWLDDNLTQVQTVTDENILFVLLKYFAVAHPAGKKHK